MRSIKMICLTLVFVLSLCLQVDSAARYETLYHLVKTGRVVKVWIGEIMNSTGNREITSERFAAVLKNALEKRKSANFVLVNNTRDADICINADIEKYDYRKVDPIDNAIGWPALAMDAMIKENYVALRVKYIVKDPKKGRVIWSKTLRPSVTKLDMPEEGCLPLVLAEAGRVFLSHCFKRPPKK
ncbi:MAG: hypothetical protein U9Q08_02605 [Candidatus Omnitrophota bacterium]|nr:hypothetical protein [Candidatus Omnitrophota bacterium]